MMYSVKACEHLSAQLGHRPRLLVNLHIPGFNPEIYTLDVAHADSESLILAQVQETQQIQQSTCCGI